MDRTTNPGTATNAFTRQSTLTPGATPSVEDYISALLNNVPFLAAERPVVTGREPPAWFVAAAWETTDSWGR